MQAYVHTYKYVNMSSDFIREFKTLKFLHMVNDKYDIGWAF